MSDYEHTHGPNGEIVYAEPVAAEPAVAEVDAVKEAAGADVEIAKINARTTVKVAELENERTKDLANQELVDMRARVEALEQVIGALQPPAPEPEPEPEPVVIEAPAEEETVPAPAPVEPTESSEPPKEKKSSGFWGSAYR